ncbi:MAG: hypothetical protein ACOYOV_14105 [Bacteroidales bacterium]
MEHTEQWANEVFGSIEGMKRASPSIDVLEKINAKLQKTVQAKMIPLRKLAWAAAAACIMITLNIYSFTSVVGGENHTIAAKEQILSDFSLYK